MKHDQNNVTEFLTFVNTEDTVTYAAITIQSCEILSCSIMSSRVSI